MGELKARMTFSEFLAWLEFIQMEESKVTKQDFYLAQIAYEVRRPTLKTADAKKLKIKDFYVKFEKPAMPKDAKTRMAVSKAAWGKLLNIPQLLSN